MFCNHKVGGTSPTVCGTLFENKFHFSDYIIHFDAFVLYTHAYIHIYTVHYRNELPESVSEILNQ